MNLRGLLQIAFASLGIMAFSATPARANLSFSVGVGVGFSPASHPSYGRAWFSAWNSPRVAYIWADTGYRTWVTRSGYHPHYGDCNEITTDVYNGVGCNRSRYLT